MLEVCQFARDASVAEAWLIAQEPYVASKDLGESVNEVEKLLKRHEAFEKSTATWEERFSALERLTTVSALNLGVCMYNRRCAYNYWFLLHSSLSCLKSERNSKKCNSTGRKRKWTAGKIQVQVRRFVASLWATA